MPSLNHVLSAENFDKGSVILNGCVGQPKEQKDNRVIVETVALNDTQQPINRWRREAATQTGLRVVHTQMKVAGRVEEYLWQNLEQALANQSKEGKSRY